MLGRMELIVPAYVDSPSHLSFCQPESLPSSLLKIKKVGAGYDECITLDSIKPNLVPGSRIGPLGRNGAGKPILIKLLAGEFQPVGGEIDLVKGIKLGHLAQYQLEFLYVNESSLQRLARLVLQKLE